MRTLFMVAVTATIAGCSSAEPTPAETAAARIEFMTAVHSCADSVDDMADALRSAGSDSVSAAGAALAAENACYASARDAYEPKAASGVGDYCGPVIANGVALAESVVTALDTGTPPTVAAVEPAQMLYATSLATCLAATSDS